MEYPSINDDQVEPSPAPDMVSETRRRRRKKAPMIPQGVWHSHKDKIRELYVDRQERLDTVMEVLRHEGFNAE